MDDEIPRLTAASQAQRAPDKWEALMQRLSANSAEAGEAYEKLRVRLAIFFERRRCYPPEIDRLVDETLERVERKTEDMRNVGAYALGVARNVALEHQRGRMRLSDAPVTEDCAEPAVREPAVFKEIRAQCLEDCLAALTPRQELVIRRYFIRQKGDPPIPASIRVRKNEIVRRILQPCCRKCFDRKIRNSFAT